MCTICTIQFAMSFWVVVKRFFNGHKNPTCKSLWYSIPQVWFGPLALANTTNNTFLFALWCFIEWIPSKYRKVPWRLIVPGAQATGTIGCRSPGDDEEYTADSHVGQQDVDPYIRGHGVHEREEAGVGAVGSAVQDTDASVQERFGEVDSFLSHKGDCERSHSKVSPLENRKQKLGTNKCSETLNRDNLVNNIIHEYQ